MGGHTLYEKNVISIIAMSIHEKHNILLAHPHPQPQPVDVTHVASSPHSEKDKKHAVQQQRGSVYFAPQNTGKMSTSTLAHVKMRRPKCAVTDGEPPGLWVCI